jgi:hypothetical protein
MRAVSSALRVRSPDLHIRVQAPEPARPLRNEHGAVSLHSQARPRRIHHSLLRLVHAARRIAKQNPNGIRHSMVAPLPLA